MTDLTKSFDKRQQVFIITLVLLSVLILFAACSRNRTKDMTITEKMELANRYFEEERFNRAAELYLDVVYERRTRHTPDAQFKLAESYLGMGRYNEAIFEYRELIRMFPEHQHLNTAHFRIAEAYYNLSLDPHYCQQETVKAIDEFERFLDRYPLDERRDEAVEYLQNAQHKLIEKKYHNGYIYYRLYDYSGALMYFDKIMELENRDELDKKSRYYSARIFIERQDKQQTKEMLDTLAQHYPQASETTRIKRLYNRTFD